MKNALKITLLGLLLVNCKKGIEENKLYIRGRLFLVDTITQYNNGTPLAHKLVTLARAGADSLNFIYSDSTDVNGYFTFPVLTDDKEQNFVVRYEDSSKGFYYKGSSPAKTGQDTITVKAYLDGSKQNGFILTLVDESLQPLPKANIRLYGNQALALLNDSAGGGSIQLFPANEYGISYKFNLPPGTYYLNADKKVDSLSYQRILKTITLKSTGFIVDTMILRRKQVVIVNGYVVKITDSTGGAIPRAKVNIFTSPLLALGNDAAGAVDSLVTDADGIVKKNNVSAGNYYFSASKIADTSRYNRYAKPITVPVSGIVTDTIILRKSN